MTTFPRPTVGTFDSEQNSSFYAANEAKLTPDQRKALKAELHALIDSADVRKMDSARAFLTMYPTLVREVLTERLGGVL